MLKLLRLLAKKWDGWVGDRDMENAMRAALIRKGLRGSSARFSQVRLVAVQRPGWLQVYSFDVVWDDSAAGSGQERPIFGLVRQDERYDKSEVELFENTTARAVLLNQWAEGLSRLR